MKKTSLSAFGILLFFSLAVPVFAQANIPSQGWGDCIQNGDVLTLACIPILMTNVINFLLGFAGIVCVVMVMYAGFKYITSQGDQARLDSARKTFLWAVVGLIFIFLSWFILGLIGRVTGVNQIPH